MTATQLYYIRDEVTEQPIESHLTLDDARLFCLERNHQFMLDAGWDDYREHHYVPIAHTA